MKTLFWDKNFKYLDYIHARFLHITKEKNLQ